MCIFFFSTSPAPASSHSRLVPSYVSFLQVVVRAERAAEFPEDTSTALHDETGHIAWQAMPVLCHFILSEMGRRLLQNARVLELGAGIGVPGLLAGRVCKELILTDNNEAVVERLQRNVDFNREDMSCSHEAVRVVNVVWGSDSFPPEHVIARHAIDVVLGSDVIYSTSSARAFLETAKGFVAQQDGVIVLAYIPRWPSVDRALHDVIREEDLMAEVVPLVSFLPSTEVGDGELSPDKAPLPKGTCLLLVRPNSFHSASTCGTKKRYEPRSSSSLASPELRVREDFDAEKALIELRIGPEHIDDCLPESCRRAGVDSETSTLISVQVDATGPISVTPLQAEALSRAFCALPLTGRVSELRFKECWLGDEGWSRLAPGLLSGGCAQTLSVLSAIGDEIGQAAASTISKMLPNCSQLSSLCLTRNLLGDAGALALAEGLATCNVLTSLTLSRCGIGDAGVAAVVKALPQSLLELDVSSNEFSALGLADMATALRITKAPALTHLNISGNELGPSGGAELAEALPVGTPQLEHLDLRGCCLADSGVKWLSEALPLCKEISTLHLGSSGMGDVGVIALADVLPSCPQLKHLGLAMNSVTGGSLHKVLFIRFMLCCDESTLVLHRCYLTVSVCVLCKGGYKVCAAKCERFRLPF